MTFLDTFSLFNFALNVSKLLYGFDKFNLKVGPP